MRGTSGGIAARSTFVESGLPPGFVAKINDDESDDPRKTGGLYVSDPSGFSEGNEAAKSPVPPGEWCRVEMIVAGDRVRILVNDKLTTDYIDPKRRFAKGQVALQFFRGTRIEFRKIEVKEFEPGDEP